MKKKIRDLVYADLGREVSYDGPGRSHVVGVLEHFEFTAVTAGFDDMGRFDSG